VLHQSTGSGVAFNVTLTATMNMATRKSTRARRRSVGGPPARQRTRPIPDAATAVTFTEGVGRRRDQTSDAQSTTLKAKKHIEAPRPFTVAAAEPERFACPTPK